MYLEPGVELTFGDLACRVSHLPDRVRETPNERQPNDHKHDR